MRESPVEMPVPLVPATFESFAADRGELVPWFESFNCVHLKFIWSTEIEAESSECHMQT